MLKKFFVWCRKQLDKRDTGVFLVLHCTGNWYVRYPTGERTHWLQYGAARNLRKIYGGDLVHRSDEPGVNSN